MNLEQFLEKQSKVYQKFKDDEEKVKLEGIIPRADVIEGIGGYLVALRHSDGITQIVEDFSKKIAKVVPTIIHGKDELHTTFLDYNVEKDFKPKNKILKTLCDCVNYAISELGNKKTIVEINFKRFLYNQNTIIVSGYPNKDFVVFAEKIVEAGSKKGIELRMPWGAHITADRFIKTVPPTKVSDFIELMKNQPQIGSSYPERIDVGYYQLNPFGMNLIIYEKFKL